MRRILGIATLVLLAGCGGEGRDIRHHCFDCEWPPIDVEVGNTTGLQECGFSSITPEGIVTVTACP